jgi:D-cysteine desulfhydrase
MGCTVVLRHTTQDSKTVPTTGNYLLTKLAGASVVLAPKLPYEGGLKPIMTALQEEHKERTGGSMYLMPVGGSNTTGLWGYIDCFAEMLSQNVASDFDDVVVTCGSGGTISGLALANYLAGSPLRIHAIAICDDAKYFYDHVDHTLQELGVPVQARDIVRIVEGYKGLGYGLSQPHELDFIAEVSRTTGILLDPVYTGKAALGLQQELLSNVSAFKGQRVLFVHTGGVFGAMDGRLDLSAS